MTMPTEREGEGADAPSPAPATTGDADFDQALMYANYVLKYPSNYPPESMAAVMAKSLIASEREKAELTRLLAMRRAQRIGVSPPATLTLPTKGDSV